MSAEICAKQVDDNESWKQDEERHEDMGGHSWEASNVRHHCEQSWERCVRVLIDRKDSEQLSISITEVSHDGT